MSWAAAHDGMNRASVRTFANATVERAGHVPFQAVFDHRTRVDELDDGVNGVSAPTFFSGPVPVLSALSDEVADIVLGEALTVNGDSYTVRDIRPDGAGVTLLTLKRS